MLKTKTQTVISVLFVCGMGILSGCSIQDETNENIKNKTENEEITQISDLEQTFIDDANLCVKGDISNLQSIIDRYKKSYRDQNYPEPYSLQKKNANRAFEKCAQKALRLGDSSAFNAMITRPGQAARISRGFYINGNLTEGAFWLQRVINIEGPENGYERAGRIFIQKKETLPIGAKLLEYSARLGSITARQSLYNLTNPSSYAFLQLTKAEEEQEKVSNNSEQNETKVDSGSSDKKNT